MGQSAGTSATSKREPLSGLHVNSTQEEQQLSQVSEFLPTARRRKGPVDNCAHLSCFPEADLSMDEDSSHPVCRRSANARTFGFSSNVIADHSSPSSGDRNSQLANLSGNWKEVGDFSGFHEAGNLPLLNRSLWQDNVNFPAARQETPQEGVLPQGDRRWETSISQGLPKTDFQHSSKLNAKLTRFQGQKVLLVNNENEVVIHKGENHQLPDQLLERIPERHSHVLQIQHTVSGLKSAIAQLRQYATSQPSLYDEGLEREIEKALVPYFDENHALHENLLQCQTELELAKHSKTSEVEEKERSMLRLEEDNSNLQVTVYEIREQLWTDRKNLTQCQTELELVKHNWISEDAEKESKILSLGEENRKLQEKVDKIQKQLCKEREGQHQSYVDGQQTPSLLESTAREMFASIGKFTNLLSKYKRPDGSNPVHNFILGSELWRNSNVARQQHWTYFLRNFVYDRFFANFENESFVASDKSVLFLDAPERVNKCFDYFQSCKFERAVNRGFSNASPLKLDYLLFQYLEQASHELLPEGCYPKVFGWTFKSDDEFIAWVRANDMELSLSSDDMQRLVQSFIYAAQKVWLFHKLCLSFDPPATIFRVSPGDTFNEIYMESTDELEADDGDSTPTVGFMVYPGFRLRKSIIKCQVYIAIKPLF